MVWCGVCGEEEVCVSLLTSFEMPCLVVASHNIVISKSQLRGFDLWW